MLSSAYFFWCLLILCRLKACLLIRLMNTSTFETDYCDLKCKGEQHTMCPTQKCVCKYSDFEEYLIYDGKQVNDLLKTLVTAHNGIRNRVAQKMSIPNMLELVWDQKLARMAENYLCKCDATQPDPCTLSDVVFNEMDTINEFYKFNHSPAYIVQNTYRERATFIPYKFFERVISYWYFDKDTMRPPIQVVGADIPISKILGENNFTHLAYPFVYRFGCGLARFDDTFHLLCNYYPFFRTVTNSMFFETGDPVTSCPARFPLPDMLYHGLCTDDNQDVTGTKSQAVQPIMDCSNIFIMFSLLFCIA